jgi:hypothetical protein
MFISEMYERAARNIGINRAIDSKPDYTGFPIYDAANVFGKRVGQESFRTAFGIRRHDVVKSLYHFPRIAMAGKWQGHDILGL